MVNTEIPKNYTASPSSFNGTPQLTINREATFDLESSNHFEGPEKLLELWLAPSPSGLPASAGSRGLMAVPAEVWNEMLDLVHCKVLSVVESDHVDAYLLSESSMFIYPHKLVLKTCGITTLLCGIPKMLEIAALRAGFPHTSSPPINGLAATAAIHRVFYSRKNFIYPDGQRGPHRSWRDEVRALDRLFRGGSAYMIGKMNGEHWYLYITEPDTTSSTESSKPTKGSNGHAHATPAAFNTQSGSASETEHGAKSGDDEDETLEILMTDLDEGNAKQFYLEHASAVAEGQYYQDLPSKRRHSRKPLGTIDEDTSHANGHSNCTSKSPPRPSASHYDVFAETSSDHADMSSDEDDHSLPSELTTEGHALGSVVSNSCGLANVYPKSKYPDARIDAYLFTPCGFSANGVIPAPSQSHEKATNTEDKVDLRTHYFTVHVTPEPQCSYASFETNVPARQTGRQTAEVVEQVVDIFKPSRFSVTLFEAKTPPANGEAEAEPRGEKTVARIDAIKGYRRVDRIVHDLDGYDLVFRHFERLDWRGDAPRLGEAL